MIAEGLQELERIIKSAGQAEVVKVPAEPDHRYWIKLPGGGLSGPFDAQAKPRSYKALSLEGVVDCVQHWIPAVDAPEAVLLVGQGTITVIKDEAASRRERINMTLARSRQFQRLTELAAPRPMDHKAFMRLLRVELSGTVSQADLDVFRAIKINKTEDGASSVNVGKESISKSVLREVALGGASVPESIKLSVPVYEDLAFSDWVKPVECAIDLDLEGDPKFTIQPKAGQLSAATIATDAQLVAYFRGALDGHVIVLAAAV